MNRVRAARQRYGDSLAAIVKQTVVERESRRETSKIIRIMPLWKLQTVGQERLDFLYENTGTGTTIELRPGVVYCCRKFHALISDLVRGAWVRYARQQNLDLLGETADLNEVLFGSERAALAAMRPVLIDIQQGRSFYCNKPLSPEGTHVDQLHSLGSLPHRLGPQLRSG
ncbi:MAG TPA: hypothetical protein VIX19_19650 [Terriglobales bacterium]